MIISKFFYVITISLFVCVYTTSNAQVVINSTVIEPSAALRIVSQDHGVLIPRITLISNTDVITIPNPAVSLLIYNQSSNSTLSPGYYYWNGTIWERLFDDEVIYERVAYDNTDIITNINANIELPIFGNLVVNEDPQLYIFISNTKIQVIKNGRYEVDFSAHLKSMINGAEPQARIEINGVPIGAVGTSGHINTNAGHQNSSIHLYETFNLTAGDILSIRMTPIGSGTITFANEGSSRITITKVQ